MGLKIEGMTALVEDFSIMLTGMEANAILAQGAQPLLDQMKQNASSNLRVRSGKLLNALDAKPHGNSITVGVHRSSWSGDDAYYPAYVEYGHGGPHYYTITSVTSTTSVCANTRVSIRGATGATGAAGADAITMSITSSAGTIFKNSAVVTTLTAHVYKAGAEVTGADLTALGTIKWYKDGSNTALSATGATLTISAGDVTNKATYVAQLEG